jgi:hypothetical protein
MKPRDFKFFTEPEDTPYNLENITEITDIVREYTEGFLHGRYDIDATYGTVFGSIRCASFDGPINQEPYEDDISRDISDFIGWDILTLISLHNGRNIIYRFTKDLATVEENELGLEPPLLWDMDARFTTDHVDDWD